MEGVKRHYLTKEEVKEAVREVLQEKDRKERSVPFEIIGIVLLAIELFIIIVAIIALISMMIRYMYY
ncbi:hypothetical protein J6Z48_03095 [bacterium]|nr:hypothetical protein [bacterium]